MRYFVYYAVRKQVSAYTKDTTHISGHHQHILNSLPKLNSNDQTTKDKHFPKKDVIHTH